MPDRSEKWDGGYVRRNAKGRPTYIIFRRIDGDLYELSTRAHTARAAVEHLRRFEEDASSYSPGGDANEPLYIDVALATKFLAWSKSPKDKGGKGNSWPWVRKKRAQLAWWTDKLHGKDLRRLDIMFIKEALKTAPGYKHHLSLIKGFIGWLVDERLLTREQDPTYRVLKVPQDDPAQWKKKKTITRDQFAAVLRELAAQKGDGRGSIFVDVLLTQAGTGWHTEETIRFAAGGSVDDPPKGNSAVFILTNPQVKSGEPLRVAVSKEVGEAAKRVVAHGSFSRHWYDRAVARAAKAAGCEDFRAGQTRHTVATFAVNAGAAVAVVSTFLGHKSPRTTKRFYATHAVPAKIPTPF